MEVLQGLRQLPYMAQGHQWRGAGNNKTRKGRQRQDHYVLYTLQGIPPSCRCSTAGFVDKHVERENYTESRSLYIGRPVTPCRRYRLDPRYSNVLLVKTSFPCKLAEKTNLPQRRTVRPGRCCNGFRFDRTSVRLNLDNNTRSWLKLSSNSRQPDDDNVGTTVTKVSQRLYHAVLHRSPPTRWLLGGYSADEPPPQGNLNPGHGRAKSCYGKRNALNGGYRPPYSFEGLQFRTNLNVGINHSNSTDFMPTWQLGSVSSSQAKLSKRSTSSY